MWYNSISKDSDVCLSSRIRFARNIEGFKFVNMLKVNEKQEIIKILNDAIDNKKYKLFKMEDLPDLNKLSLMEQHIISKEFVPSTNSAVITNEDNSCVAMVNEEDHLRLQAFEPGFNVDECYKKLCDFVNDLESKVKFSKSEDYGYLTACPTNVGSGMRVSVMMHLPALAKIGILNQILDQAASIGMSVRGMYGENTKGDGYLYQISNQKTLGMSDENIISSLKAVVTSIIEQERRAREILKNKSVNYEDEIYRAYGTLANARLITEEEALKLLSKLRLGVCTKTIDNVSLECVQKLMGNILSSTLKINAKKDLTKHEELKFRANIIREELK